MRVDRAAVVGALRQAVNAFKAHDLSSLAAGVAFRLFLSLFPSLIAAVAILGIVTPPSELPQLLASVRGFVPAEAYQILEDALVGVVESSATGGIAVAAVAGGVLAAVGAALTVVKALNAAHGVGESRKFVKLRLIGLVITGALLLALVGVFLLLVVGPVVVEAILPARLGDFGLRALIAVGRYAGAIAVLALLFAFMLWIGPDRPRPAFRWVTPGATVGVVGWLLLSYGFSLYVRTLGNYGENSAYGALGTVVVLLLWLQLSFTVLLFGAEIDAVMEQRAAAKDSAGGEPVALAPPTAMDLVPAPTAGRGPPPRFDARPSTVPRGAVGSVATLAATSALAFLALRWAGRRQA